MWYIGVVDDHLFTVPQTAQTSHRVYFIRNDVKVARTQYRGRRIVPCVARTIRYCSPVLLLT